MFWFASRAGGRWDTARNLAEPRLFRLQRGLRFIYHSRLIFRREREGRIVHSIVNYLGPAAKELLAAWALLPKHECVPDRQSFDPMAVARILPVITLLQRGDDEEWRFRLVGTEVDRRWGRPLTGLKCIEIAAPEMAAIIRREFGEVVRHPCGSWSVRHVEFDSGRCATIETMRLPLRAKDGSVSLILGSSGELPAGAVHELDRRSAIVTIAEQQFFDIGAGIPVSGALSGAAAHSPSRMTLVGESGELAVAIDFRRLSWLSKLHCGHPPART